MIKLQLISTFQHQLTTVNAGAHQLVLRYIQELLGHGNLKATEIYTHLSKKSLANSKSPLDDIVASQRTENQNLKHN